MRAASHSAHSATPSPLVAAMRKIGALGLRVWTSAVNSSSLKSKTGIVSTLLRMTASEIWKMPGYLYGLSWPSGTERIMTLAFSPR